MSVIFARDLVYDAGWRGNRKISHDSVVKKAPEEEFVNLVEQTYRVLLTREMKSCYGYLEDAGTKDFFLSRVRTEAERSGRKIAVRNNRGWQRAQHESVRTFMPGFCSLKNGERNSTESRPQPSSLQPTLLSSEPLTSCGRLGS